MGVVEMGLRCTLVFLLFTIIVKSESPTEQSRSRQKRDTVGLTSKRWARGIVPYQYSDQAHQHTKFAFNRAIRVIQTLSCVKFVRRKYERDYIHVITGTGCYSMIGRIGGRQALSLGKGCFRKGVAVHEVLHALGFYHEQSRLDRDNHVIINHYNVLDRAKKQFMKYKFGQGHTLGEPYDPDSIMHYSNKDFSKNGRDTITYRNNPHKLLGKKAYLSKTDVVQLNKLYNCARQSEDKEGESKKVTKVCRDNEYAFLSGQCTLYFFVGTCYTNPHRMRYLCPKTCGYCRNVCQDTARDCSFYSLFGFCRDNTIVRTKCKKTCGLC